MKTIWWREPPTERVYRPGDFLTFPTRTHAGEPLIDLPLHSDLINDAGSGAVTFSRASVATVIDHNGDVQDCYANEARFKGCRRIDHGDGQDYGAGVLGVQYVDTGSSEGLLIEQASENLITHSDDVQQWTPEATIQVDAQTLSFSNSAAAAVFLPGLPTGVTLTISCMARSGDANATFRLRCGSTSGFSGDFNLTPEWQHFQFTREANDGASARICNGFDGAGRTIEVKAIQVEQLAFSTSAIRTSGATATRAGDLVSMAWPTGLANNFAISCRASVIESVNNQQVLDIVDATRAGRVFSFVNAAEEFLTNKEGTSVNSAPLAAGIHSLKSRVSASVGVDIWTDNVKGAPTGAHTADVSPVPTEMYIGGNYLGQGQLNGTMRDLSVYGGDLSDEEVVSLP